MGTTPVTTSISVRASTTTSMATVTTSPTAVISAWAAMRSGTPMAMACEMTSNSESETTRSKTPSLSWKVATTRTCRAASATVTSRVVPRSANGSSTPTARRIDPKPAPGASWLSQRKATFEASKPSASAMSPRVAVSVMPTSAVPVIPGWPVARLLMAPAEPARPASRTTVVSENARRSTFLTRLRPSEAPPIRVSSTWTKSPESVIT